MTTRFLCGYTYAQPNYFEVEHEQHDHEFHDAFGENPENWP
jgi:hypothetical protein